MAKENKKPETKAEEKKSEMTAENVVEQIRNKNLMNDDAVKAALEQIAKDADENKKREAMRAIKKFEYKNAKALIELRRRRAEEKVTKEYLSKTKENLDNFLGGKITVIEANEEDKKARKTHNDEIDKLNREFDGYLRELREAYPEYWCWDWDRD